MRTLLLDPDNRLDTPGLQALAERAGLAPCRFAAGPDDGSSVELPRELPDSGWLLFGELDTLQQAAALDSRLDDRDAAPDLVLLLAADPRPLEQRLCEPEGGDAPAAAHYRSRGLLRRVWVDADPQHLQITLAQVIRDARRARHPEREAPFPPEVARRQTPRAEPAPPHPGSAPPVAADAPAPAAEAAPAAEEDASPAWRRAAEQRGRIKRRGTGAGGRAGKGWRPKN